MRRFFISFSILFSSISFYGQNLSFVYPDIAHVYDAQPSFVSGAGGDVVISAGVDEAACQSIENAVMSSFGTSGITLGAARRLGHDGEYQLYELVLHIPSIPLSIHSRCLSFRGSSDLSMQSTLQSWEEMRGTISGIGHENLFPGEHFTVVVSDAECDTGYTLYRDDGNTRTPIETRSCSTSNGSIYFDVAVPGTYIVGNGSQFCQGSVYAYEANFFSPGFLSLETGGSTYSLPPDGGSFSVSLHARDGISEDDFCRYVDLLTSELVQLWDCHLSLDVDRLEAGGEKVILSLSCGPNLSSDAYIGDTGFCNSYGSPIRFIQPSGGHVLPFLAWGSAGPGRTLVANLNGSQVGVRYDLVPSGEEPPGNRSEYGTGNPLSITAGDTSAVYDVFAIYDDGYSIYRTRKMIGNVSMPPAMPPPLDDHPEEPGNWIREYTFTDTEGAYVLDVSYFDSLGFQEQRVRQDYLKVNGTYSWVNNVSVTEYDCMMNPETRVPLPFSITSSGVSKCANCDGERRSAYSARYGDADLDYLFGGTEHEQSSRERPILSFKPGRSYSDSSRISLHSYGLNSAGEVPAGPGTFLPAHSLFRHTLADEEGRTMSEYYDTRGRCLLLRELCQDGSSHDIRYSYDVRDRLSAISSGISYGYDEYGRVAQKMVNPGDRRTFIYDDGDRVILEVGGDTWRRFIYDEYGRRQSVYVKSGSWVGYDTLRDSIVSSPAGQHPLDDFGGVLLSEYGYSDYRSGELAFVDWDGRQSARLSTKIRGLLTYEKHLVLDADSPEYCSGNYVERAYFYDGNGRILQSVEKTQLGSILRCSYDYDFRGNVTAEHIFHNIDGHTDVLERTFAYDCRDRCLSCTELLPGSASASMHFSYDWLGRECERVFTSSSPLSGGRENMTSHCSYDIEGRITSFGDELFSQNLHYQDTTLPGSTPRYDGKVSACEWVHGTDSSVYIYHYDRQGRLVNAVTDNQAGVCECISYLPDGRPSGIGHSTASGVQTDSLKFTGTGKVPAGITEVTTGINFGIGYDSQGRQSFNALEDRGISYNLLNLPCLVETPAGSINYSYLADGKKCGTMDASLNGFEYIGPFVYGRDGESISLSSVSMANGRFVRDSGADGFIPEYWSVDYLGSVRARDCAGEVTDYDYTPYGRLWGNGFISSSDNQYGFNGKEYQSSAEVNLYDYGARMYSPLTAMWTTPDPLYEKNHLVNAFAFCAGDPVNFVDPDGRDIWRFDINGYLVDDTPIKNDQNDIFMIVMKNDKGKWEEVLGGTVYLPFGSIKQIDNKAPLFSIANDKDAWSVFEFMANNTDVEWSIVTYSDETSAQVGTSNKKFSNSTIIRSIRNNESRLKEIVHSHPYEPYPSDSDKSLYSQVKKKSPLTDIQFYIYHVQSGTYIIYNEFGAQYDDKMYECY